MVRNGWKKVFVFFFLKKARWKLFGNEGIVSEDREFENKITSVQDSGKLFSHDEEIEAVPDILSGGIPRVGSAVEEWGPEIHLSPA